MEILTTNHYDKIFNLFEETSQTIKIISPFISEPIAKRLCDIVKTSNIKCQFITRFYLQDMFAKANSMDAIEMMIDAGIEMYALKGLHTKLYLFDEEYGVLGSANFTAGGFKSNIELSLLLDKEDDILSELHGYFNDLLIKIKACDEGLITKEVLERGRKNYKHTFNAKKENDEVRNAFTYGAQLDRKVNYGKADTVFRELEKYKDEEDIVNSAFKNLEQHEQIQYDHTIWLKFSGEGNDRFDGKEKFDMVSVKIGGKTCYIANYPFKVSVEENDEIYFAAIATDSKGKNQPMIVGRGHLMAFTEENYVEKEWLEIYDWMDRYLWYCIVKDAQILDGVIEDGIPMDELWDKLGSNTYNKSFGRNETIAEVARKHYQKAHIKLSGNAKEYIDKRLDELEKKYGIKQYSSDIWSSVKI